MDIFKEMYDVLLEKGVYIGPSGYEVGFISDAHTAEQSTPLQTLLQRL